MRVCRTRDGNQHFLTFGCKIKPHCHHRHLRLLCNTIITIRVKRLHLGQDTQPGWTSPQHTGMRHGAASPSRQARILGIGDRGRCMLHRRTRQFHTASHSNMDARSFHQRTGMVTDGAFLLAAHPGQKEDGVVFVVSLDPAKEANDGSDAGSGWVARISSGSDGLSHATWAPPHGPKTVILYSQNHLRASLYNLVDQHISAIEGPKHDKIVWSAKQPKLLCQHPEGRRTRLVVHLLLSETDTEGSAAVHQQAEIG